MACIAIQRFQRVRRERRAPAAHNTGLQHPTLSPIHAGLPCDFFFDLQNLPFVEAANPSATPTMMQNWRKDETPGQIARKKQQ
jgi:hypothetical protein